MPFMEKRITKIYSEKYLDGLFGLTKPSSVFILDEADSNRLRTYFVSVFSLYLMEQKLDCVLCVSIMEKEKLDRLGMSFVHVFSVYVMETKLNQGGLE